jgi:hypothetical protein
MKLRHFVIACIFILLAACGNSSDSSSGRKAVYVKPSIDYKGKFRKGHVRMPVSTKKERDQKSESFKVLLPNKGKIQAQKELSIFLHHSLNVPHKFF